MPKPDTPSKSPANPKAIATSEHRAKVAAAKHLPPRLRAAYLARLGQNCNNHKKGAVSPFNDRPVVQEGEKRK